MIPFKTIMIFSGTKVSTNISNEKISFPIICAWFLSSKYQFKLINNQIFSFILYLFISCLILFQPDFSMFVIISCIYFGQLFISGLKWKWVLFFSFFFCFVSFFSFFFLNNVKMRIDNFLYS